MKTINTISLIIFFIFIILIYENIHAFRDGIVGFTKKGGNETGCVCHGFDPNDSVGVRISGPTSVPAGDTAIYVLTVSNGPAVAGGCDIAANHGDVYPSVLDSSLKRQKSFQGQDFELTHKYPKLFQSDTLRFTFKYIAPLTPNITDTLFANGNSTNQDTTSDNDRWNYANNFVINVTKPSGISGNSALINSFDLAQNFPNPFNPETQIKFSISKSSKVSMVVYNAVAKEVARLIDGKYYNPGEYSLTFNADQFNLTSGIYYYKLFSGESSDVKKMMLVK